MSRSLLGALWLGFIPYLFTPCQVIFEKPPIHLQIQWHFSAALQDISACFDNDHAIFFKNRLTLRGFLKFYYCNPTTTWISRHLSHGTFSDSFAVSFNYWFSSWLSLTRFFYFSSVIVFCFFFFLGDLICPCGFKCHPVGCWLPIKKFPVLACLLSYKYVCPMT